MKSKVLAIYLPQFHTIPENDAWWGKGFTEWSNVKRGHPFYPGHYQPRIPLNNDYYDLSDLKVLEKHIRMAKKAGVYGFCFYHYYFKGKTLLEKPIQNYRKFSKRKFPYCLIWANQSWERTWYRATKNRNVLLKQSYGNEGDWKDHFNYLLDFFKDERYIKINNKPVYIIYIPQDIHCKKRMFDLWNDMAKENGFAGIYLIAMNTSLGSDNRTELYDAYMDFEPMYSLKIDHSWRKWVRNKKYGLRQGKSFENSVFVNAIFADNIYSYSYLTRQAVQRFKKNDDKVYAGIFAGWDNTARKDEDGLIVTGCSPLKFGKALGRMLVLSEKQNKEFVFINAWNEWSECAYLEPDSKYGYAYLKTLKEEIGKYERRKNEKRNGKCCINSWWNNIRRRGCWQKDE